MLVEEPRATVHKTNLQTLRVAVKFLIYWFQFRHKALVLGESGSFLMMIQGDDTVPEYQKCCVNSPLCHLYYKRRSIDSCQYYSPPATGLHQLISPSIQNLY